MTWRDIPSLVIASDPDEDDRAWLERHVNTFAAGMKAAHAAAMEIVKNWSKGRSVGRLFPDYKDAASFLQDYIGPLRLPREERDQLIVLLIESGASRRGAAKVTGVGSTTANRAVGAPNGAPPKPHDYSADLRAGVNKLAPIVHAVHDERWAPDVTEATLLLFLARALTEIAQAHGASVEPGNVIDEIETYLATEGRLP